MAAAILIVGDDPMLLQTRAELLREWQVSTSTSQRAFQAVHAAAYNLLIICQTVSDTMAGQLIDKARQINPYVVALAISQIGQERTLKVELFEVQLSDPGRLRLVVTDLLQQADSDKQARGVMGVRSACEPHPLSS
jgi:DNA-binding response OmpR family regulator